MIKTNVMRILEREKVCYTPYFYTESDAVGGMEVAALLGKDPNRTFKTLVTVATSGQHYVFLVPVCRELSLKKAAQTVGEKKIEMLKSRELLPLTGYVHGGCSPIGMKKFFPTTVDRSAADFETVLFSGGKIGCQVELPLAELKKVIEFRLADITE